MLIQFNMVLLFSINRIKMAATYSYTFDNSNYDKDSEPPEYIDIIPRQAPSPVINAPACSLDKQTSQNGGNKGGSLLVSYCLFYHGSSCTYNFLFPITLSASEISVSLKCQGCILF